MMDVRVYVGLPQYRNVKYNYTKDMYLPLIMIRGNAFQVFNTT